MCLAMTTQKSELSRTFQMKASGMQNYFGSSLVVVLGVQRLLIGSSLVVVLGVQRLLTASGNPLALTHPTLTV